MAECIEREAAIAIIEEKQKRTMPCRTIWQRLCLWLRQGEV